MKSFGKIILTVYLTITTLASGIFGFLYFNSKDYNSDYLSISVIKGVVDDVVTTMSGMFNESSQNTQNSQISQSNIVYASEENFDITTYYSSNEEVELIDKHYKSLVYHAELFSSMAKIFLNNEPEYDKVYFDDTINEYDNSNITHYFSLKSISSLKSKVIYFSLAYGCEDSFEMLIDKSNSSYEYIIELKWNMDILDPSSHSESQIMYITFGKLKNNTSFEYFNWASCAFTLNLETVLQTNLTVDDLSYNEGGLANLISRKVKFGTKEQNLSAINAIKKDVVIFNYLKHEPKQTQISFWEEFRLIEDNLSQKYKN